MMQATTKPTSRDEVNRMRASELLGKAAELVCGPRAEQHGDMEWNHHNIALLWTAYCGGMALDGHGVALMMALLKIARTKTGSFNVDDYIDAAAYIGIAYALKRGQRIDKAESSIPAEDENGMVGEILRMQSEDASEAKHG